MANVITSLDEREICDGYIWFAAGPRGKEWAIVWQSAREADNMRAWPLPGGRTAHFDHATDLDTARAKAQQIADKIATGKR